MPNINQINELRVAIDTGGTFTDIVLSGISDGNIQVTKVPSTPHNPALALIHGIRSICAQSDTHLSDLAAICHGTTVATNALLQSDIENLSLIVTKGFRHILEIARQAVPDGYGNSYFWVKPERIVPVHRVFEVDERLNFKGEVLKELDEQSVRDVARKLKKFELRSAGVCLIHSYANPSHEERVREILEEEYPELTLSLSSEVWPEYREYERAVTTLVDAFVKPHMKQYLGRIDQEMPDSLKEIPFLVMQSSGGVLSSKQVADKPISTALSGPAAGVIGASKIAELAGFENVVTLDAGGTSTDICLVENSKPHISTGASIGPFPVRLPMIDIRTVGTGGGSIAWISRENHLKVGPVSAGADPGPMCYPNGGDRPTITDANVVLGRLPSELIGGGIQLDVDRARLGLAKLGTELGSNLTVEELAEGIVEIANWSQANLIRQMTIEQGIDPRDFALLSFGGSGPAQSPMVMALLGLKACIVPPNPGNLSAFGLLMVDYRSDHVYTKVIHEDEIDLKEIASIYRNLEIDAAKMLMKDGVESDRTRFVRQADIRYAGQSMEVRVTAPEGSDNRIDIAQMIDNFHSNHERTFGYSYRGEQNIEIVNFSVSGFGHVVKPKTNELKQDLASPDKPSPLEIRSVFFDKNWIDTPVYDRTTLAPTNQLVGPAVIQEFGSTTVVNPGQSMTVDPYGILIVQNLS